MILWVSQEKGELPKETCSRLKEEQYMTILKPNVFGKYAEPRGSHQD